jgi:hypothetical protein
MIYHSAETRKKLRLGSVYEFEESVTQDDLPLSHFDGDTRAVCVGGDPIYSKDATVGIVPVTLRLRPFRMSPLVWLTITKTVMSECLQDTEGICRIDPDHGASHSVAHAYDCTYSDGESLLFTHRAI